jgi:predicted transcriptional regulator
MKRRPPRSSGALEREVVACLAASGQPMTPSEVQAELGGDLAYTTVMTTLSRLHAKHALTRTPRGRAYAYELVGGVAGAQASVTAHRMQQLLENGADRAGVLSRFVEGLDSDSEQLLRGLLDEHSRVDSPAEPQRRPGKHR